MTDIDFQLLVDGTDLTDYVVISERDHSMCNPIGALNIVLAPDLPIAISPYQDVIFYERGTKVFTGYSQEDIAARLPVEVSMRCADVLIRAQDSWFTGPLVANGESVVAWIKNFLNRAGIRKISVEVSENYSIYPGYGWEYTTCWDAITTCTQQSPYQVFADRHGVVHIKQTKRGAADYTINEYASYDRVTNDSWVRNRAVVYGNGFVVNKQEANPHLLPGEVRAAIVATGQIHWVSTADAIASKMLSEFRDPLDLKVIEVEGDPDYEITQIVDFTDPETGYHKSDCIITGINTVMNAEDGHVTEITLDEKCVSFWGWDTEPPPPLPKIYTAMSASGVYKSDWDPYNPACNWSTYNNGLSGSALTVYDFKITDDNDMWIATAGGLYRRPKGSNTWQRIVLPEPEEGFGEPEVTSICVSKICRFEVFVLTHKEIGGVHYVWLYRAIRNGLMWKWVALEAPCNALAQDGYIESLTLGGDGYRKFATYLGGLYTFNVSDAAHIYGARSDALQTWTSVGGHSIRFPSSMITGDGGPYRLWMCGSQSFLAPGITLQAWNGAGWTTFENNRTGMYDLVLRANGEVCVSDFDNGSIRRYDNAGNYLGEYILPNPGGLPHPRGVYERSDGTLFVTTVSAGAPNPEVYRHIGGNNWVGEGAGSRGATTPFGEQDGLLFSYSRSFGSSTLMVRDDNTQTWGGDIHSVPVIGGVPQKIGSIHTLDGVIYVGTDKGRIYRRDSINGYGLVGAVSCDDVENDKIRIHNIVYHEGDWIASAVYDRFGVNENRVYRIPGPSIEVYVSDEGRTHLLDMDEDGYLYANVITIREDRPLTIRVYRTLIDAEDEPLTRRTYGPVPLGTWSGVLCEWGRVWVFGDLDCNQIVVSENNGETWTDKSDPSWANGEKVRSVVPSYSLGIDHAAILNGVEEAWVTKDDGDIWTKQSDIIFAPNFGREMFSGIEMFIGDTGPSGNILQYSPTDADNWEEQSTGIPAGKRMANILEEIDYI